MWALKFLPDWVFYGLTIIGFTGLIANRLIPTYYRSAVQATAAAFFVFGVYMCGAISNDQWWREQVKTLQDKIAVAEAESKQAITTLTAKLDSKTEALKQRNIENIKYIEIEREKIDAMCTVPQEFIFIINKAAEQPE
jgi:hypothetical protein